MENQTETTAPSQGNKGFATLAAVAGVLFVAALGLGTAYFFEMEHASDLQRQVDDLKAAAARMDEEMAKDAHAGHVAPMSK